MMETKLCGGLQDISKSIALDSERTVDITQDFQQKGDAT